MTEQTLSEIAHVVALSPMQQGMLFHTLLAPDAGMYVEQVSCEMENCDTEALRQAWDRVIARHEALRSAFVWESIDKPVQVVYGSVEAPWNIEDWRSFAESEQERRFEEYLAAERSRGFQVDKAPLMRFSLFRTSDARYKFVWTHHHLLLDGWSLRLVFREVLTCYEAALRGEQPALPPTRPYRAFIDWVERQDRESAAKFWRSHLKGLGEVAFSSGLNLASPDSGHTLECSRLLSAPLTAQLERLARSLHITLNTLLQGAWALLLSRYSGRANVVFGTTVSIRPPEIDNIESVAGLLINTIPVSVAVAGDKPLSSWLSDIQASFASAEAHAWYPLPDIQMSAGLPGGIDLFDSLLVFENTPAEQRSSAATLFQVRQFHSTFRTNYPITVVAGVHDGQLKLSASIDCKCDDTTAARLLDRLEGVLESLVSDSGKRVGEVELLSEGEAAEQRSWNETERDYPRRGLGELFAETVLAHRDEPAGKWVSGSLTYGELNARANRLAWHLRRHGVGPESLVGLSVEEGLEAVLGMLAVVKAGGAYIPLRREDPRRGELVERLHREQGMRWLVVSAEKPEFEGVRAISLVCDGEAICAESDMDPPGHAAMEQLAYVIHTSGSTGIPKGIAVTHAGVVRLVREADYLQAWPGMRMGQISTYAFDAATFEVWGALLNGGCLVEVPQDVKLWPKRLAEWLRAERIDAMFLTAALFNQVASEVPESFGGMDTLLVGGEALTAARVREVLEAGGPRRLLNGYGPTECTTFALWHPLRLEDTESSVPIGRPLANTEAWVLGAHLERQPVGVLGEIGLGGPGVARGYLGDARRTAERFVPHPCARRPGERLYLTGDWGRWRRDGVVEYAGRRDGQIKLRGFRIEPGEIEAALKAHPGVRDAAVALRAGKLCAWTAAEDGLSADELRRHLESRLPGYMVPAAIATLPSLPLNHNGKIDRNALQDIEIEQQGESALSSEDAILEIVRAIFSGVLGLASVASDGNFFELGGHSLTATQLISRVRDALSVDTEFSDFYRSPTPRGVAESVRKARGAGASSAVAPPLERADSGAERVLSFAQERLWFLNQLEPESPFYNTPGILKLQGQLNKEALSRALHEIVLRHEVFRTRYENRGGKPVAVVDEECPKDVLRETDLRALPREECELKARQLASAEVRQPFQLSTGPVFRFHLLRLAEREHILIVVMHHIISDGWSLGVLVREAAEFYRAFATGRAPELDPLPVRYSDFALWQRTWLQGEELERQLGYWKKTLAGAPPALHLPTDRPRPREQSFRGNTVRFEITALTSESIRILAGRNGATPFMALLAAFCVLLHRFSRQSDIVIGSPIANRNLTGIEGLIGFFVNTLPLRIGLEGEPSFEDFLLRVRDIALEAFDRQNVPFERLIEDLQPERDLSRSPLFQAMFTMQNAPVHAIALPDLTISPIQPDQPSALFDISLDMWWAEGNFRGALEYATDLFDEETANRMASCFNCLLDAIARDASVPISALPLLTTTERRRVLALGNGPSHPYPPHSIGELFEKQARSTPERIAATHNGCSLAYAELNARANRIAHWLRAQGARPNDLVGILTERGLDYACSLLGILKAGAAFVPFDPAYPAERVQSMLEDSSVRWLIAGKRVPERYVANTSQLRSVLCFDTHDHRSGGLDIVGFDSLFDEREPAPVNSPEDTAYAMYTSGSTGLPKAALVRHNGAVNHIFAEALELSLDSNLIFLQSAPTSSDISVWQYLGPWLLGGCTHIVDGAVVSDGARLFESLRDSGVTLIELVPAVLNELLHHAASLPAAARALPALQCAMVTGESAPAALINRWFEIYPHIPLANAYGPTEAADDVCQARYIAPLPAGIANSPIGRPLANLNLYVLDSRLRLVPIGVPGEICVAGIGVGKGYWKRDDLTRAAFASNPYPGFGRTLYRTGDLGRWRADGQLEFAGRIDQQVKIRGFRIETGEIESALLKCPAVRDAVITVAGPDDNRRLIAWLTPGSENAEGLPLSQLENEQVSLWKALHENSYRDGAPADPEFNTVGWDSNYTRAPLSEAEMREYVDHTVERVLEHKPERILEIGCGTGLLAYPLARGCREYVGTDFSSVAVGQLAADSATRRLTNARFLCAEAHALDGIDGSFDAILLASVVQYFPGTAYFLDVIGKAIERLRPGGILHITDVRSLVLLRAYHASVQLFQAPDNLTASELNRRVLTTLRQEQELAFDPLLFRCIPTQFPKVRYVEIAPKRGRLDNEMTCFRYDVSLYTVDAQTTRCEWQSSPDTLSKICALLENQPESLALRRVPNARTAPVAKVVSLIAQQTTTANSSALREIAAEQGGVHPEELREAARGFGYDVCFSQWESRADGAYDAVFRRLDSVARPRFFDPVEEIPPLANLVNNPLREKLQSVLAPVLREFLKKRLPEHMVPSQFIVLDAMPLGPGGKVDRRSLIAPDEILPCGSYAAPGNDTERKLIAIWAQVLEIAPEMIGVNDNFFELGGHSLKATRIASLVQREFGIAMPVREIFGSPTVTELARALPRLARGGMEPIPAAPAASYYPLSPAQRAIWMHQQLSPTAGLYNMTSARLIAGDLNLNALQDAFAAVLQRHESLRTIICERNGEPVQEVLPQSQSRIERIACPDGEHPLVHARRILEGEAIRPLDESKGECIRAVLIQLAPQQHLLFTVVSHLVFDGISELILMRDLTRVYERRLAGDRTTLPPLEIQFKDYAAWRLGQPSSADYWISTLTPLPPALDLPCDRPRQERLHRGSVETMDLGQELFEQLRNFARQSGSSIYSVLVSGVAALLNRYSGQTDMLLGAPTDGRAHPDLHDQIGCFVNLLPLRARVSSDEPFSALHGRIAAALAEALEHPHYDLSELLARGLTLPHSPGRLPLIEAIVSLQVAEQPRGLEHGLRIEEFDYDLPVSQFDVGFYFTETRDGLRLELRYASELFNRGTITKMASRLAGLLACAVKAKSQPLCDLLIEEAPPLPVLNIAEAETLSPHQERLWFIDQFETGTIYPSQPTYHVVPLLLRFEKRVDVSALEVAIRVVVAQYGELRSTIVTRDGKPIRGRALSTAVTLERYDGNFIEALAFARQPLPLDSSPPLRAGIFAGDTLLAVGLHHAFVDPCAVSRIGAAIRAQYEAADVSNPSFPVETVSGAQFAAWQANALQGEATEPHRFYWRARLRGYEAPLRLPEDRPRAAVHVYDGAALTAASDPALDQAIAALAIASGVTESIAVMTAFAALLFHYSQQQRMIIGWMHPNRDENTENTVGALANLLPICLDVDPQIGFAQLALCVAGRMCEAERMRAIPFERLVESVRLQVDMSRTALFDVLFRYEHVGDTDLVSGFGYGKYDLQLCSARRPGSTEFVFVYNVKLFERETMERMSRHFRAILLQAALDPARTLGDLSLVDAADLDRELNAWNPHAQQSRAGNIVSLFEEQASQHGGREAVVMGAARLTYEELNRRANQLAHYLLARGIQQEQLVGVCLDRSPDLIVVLLAILKAGAAYLPISPDLPSERVAFMAADAALQYWIGSRSTAAQAPPGLSTVILDRDGAGVGNCRITNPNVAISGHHLAYCIFTSGSTGKPKGVLVEHRNVVHLLFDRRIPFEFSKQDVWTMFHSASFDFSVWEIFGALLHGGKLVMVPRPMTLDPDLFVALLAEENVTVLNQTPGAFYHLIPATAKYPDLALRYVIFGGEALQPIQLLDFRKRYPSVRLVNMYGITETTVHVTFKAINDAEIESNSASIGLPLPGATLYLMDDHRRLLPPGVPGEICVGGAGVARGYLNRPELTAQKFVANPLRPAERLYRSGDRGRRLANGEILYLGRIDNQVQVRGYRIELGEIEEAMSSFAGIQQAATIALEQGGTHRVIAWYAPPSGTVPPDPVQVRAHLRSRLPEYMIPSDLIPLTRLPVTANGKIDRAALPALEAVRISVAQELLAPANEMEEQIGAIWRKVLNREIIGVNQNFFDAGGDSLRLVQVRAGLRETLGLDIPIADLFRYPTIYDLAKHLDDAGEVPDLMKSDADDRAATRRASRARRAAKR